ncbi:hypothetical protein [Clostridium sp. 'White wine YQ']|uniref:hypothetical protein n=1 Tax=Clostridium sp. 'White wine YQ' TaxID=3027474 RepID=UPI002365D580|nr:hypothetical protein [Clostridium sp. 'White wine YQ']MDD7793951.1 hypothetical protein [Clostridium sp. 'White wine YQ']
MALNKKVLINKDKISFIHENKEFYIRESNKYESLIKGNISIVIKGETLMITKINTNKRPDKKFIYETINSNFFNSKDKLFHYIYDKKNKTLIIYSIVKPFILNKIIERASIKKIIPYEVFLFEKYKRGSKNKCRMICYIEESSAIAIGIVNGYIVFLKEVDKIEKERLASVINDFKIKEKIKEMELMIKSDERELNSFNIEELRKELI